MDGNKDLSNSTNLSNSSLFKSCYSLWNSQVLPPLEDEKEKRRKKIEELRIKNDLPSENVQTNIGLVGQTLETVEHFTFNLWGSLWNININPDSPPPIQDSLQPVYSITVVKVNWYYREQSRTLKFYEEEFKRYDPALNVEKSTRRYNQIKRVITINDTDFQLTYTDGTEEYFRTSHANQLAGFFSDLSQGVDEEKM